MRHYWVDRIEVVEPGVEGRGLKAVGLSEDVFADHFPGNPVFPGIYIVEGMAQTAGALIARASGWREFALMVSVDRARFSSFVRPGDVVEYRVRIDERSGGLARMRGTATVCGRKVAQAGITFQILERAEMVPGPWAEAWDHTLALLFGPEGAGPDRATDG